MNQPTVTILVPTRNEAPCLPIILPKLVQYNDYELLVVDGHSTDRTRDLAKQYGARVILDNHKGKGDGLCVGIEQAQGEIIIFIDADGSHDPADIPKLLAPLFEDKADLVVGSRMLGGSDELFVDFSHLVRLIGQQIISISINYRFGVRLTDAQNGFRAARREALLRLELKENLHTIEQEMVIKALHKGYRIVEVPTHEYARFAGESKVSVWRMGHRYVYSWLKSMYFPGFKTPA